MLAEIAAANAAYAVIKEALANGGQLHEMGQKLIGYFDASSEIEKKAQASGKSDMELFMAREQLRAQEEELKELLIYQGRPGLWTDWLTFKRDAKLARDAEEKRLREIARKRREALKTWVYAFVIVFGVVTGLIVIGFVIHALMKVL
jgi:uncharacterized membrane protein YraQ (UPF0718 family)